MIKFSEYYQYRVFQSECGWMYEIYNNAEVPELIRESKEWFDNESRARYAAIGHISLLEQGEG